MGTQITEIPAAVDFYENAEIGKIIIVKGFNFYKGKTTESGRIFLDELIKQDEKENILVVSNGKKVRRHKKYSQTAIGGYLAHKIFTHQRVINDGVPYYRIWRVQ